MAQQRLPMRKIRDVLRLSAAGLSKRQIAASLGLSATAAGECIRRARRVDLTWPLPEGLTDDEGLLTDSEQEGSGRWAPPEWHPSPA